MKQLLAVVLLFFATSVSAGEVAVMKNEAGGQIVLTQQECPVSGAVAFRLAYTTSPDLRVYGCWQLQSNSRAVHVFWITPDGDTHYKVYDSANFKLVKEI
jgi:hypothetical protein